MRAAPASVAACIAGLATAMMLPTSSVRAETVYEFAVSCHEDQLAACFALIKERLDRVKERDQGRAFCLPRAWGTPAYLTHAYPVSVLEHIRLSLSAARFGKSEMPVEDAISDILKQIYPCD